MSVAFNDQTELDKFYIGTEKLLNYALEKILNLYRVEKK